MAPSPEDDNAPKAPDKPDKIKNEKAGSLENPKERDKDEKTLSNLNDGELKALLDEAMNYKNPKDREGKSKLFKDLLNQAEESERIARAASAGGSELVRHCNPAAKRRKGGRHQRAAEAAAARERRSSAAEHPMHGGSLDNLAKEELYARCSASRSGALGTGASRRTVSSRQREGGSLPCDVNSSLMPTRDYQFLEEARKSKAMKNKEFTTIDIDALESQSLLEHDVLAQNYQEAQEPPLGPTYTSKATLQISATPVDDPIPLDLDSAVDKKTYDSESLQTKVCPSKYSIYIHEKKLDENGNAVQQNSGTKIKKKKNQIDKKVIVLNAELVKGHRSDIIDDLDKLMQYIGGEKDKDYASSGKSKSNLHKSKQLHKQHASEDGGARSKKQRAHSSKGKESRSELKKSNSLGQISTAQLDDFSFASGNTKDESQVVLRSSKGQIDRPKERRSWGNVEPPSFEILSSSASIENLETTDNWVVTKPKKKSKKRRNSISSSGGRRQNSTSESAAARQPTNRAPSPDLRGAKSVPYSEKSNDSSDVDSVHSLPIDGLNVTPISYADIAKNTEKSKEKKLSPEKPEKVVQTFKDKSPTFKLEIELKPVVTNHKLLPPDVNNPKNFPAIPSEIKNTAPDVTITKNFPTVQPEPKSLPPDVNNPKAFPAIQPESKNPLPDVNNPKSFPAISSDLPKNGSSETVKPVDVNNPKNFPELVSLSSETTTTNVIPPDFINNPKNFPAITPEVRNFVTVDKTNVKANSGGAVSGGGGGKVTRNVSPSRNKCAVNNNVKSDVAYLRLNSCVRVNVKVSACVLENNIQNDLSIIHSNEKDSIQFNAQMLPPNIPDVQTIEKMQFMNRPPPPLPVTATVAYHHQQRPPPPSPPPPPLTAGASYPNNCDSSERTISAEAPVAASVIADQELEEDEAADDGRIPPVIILSGGGNCGKEVPGLVFGFDINEQLLSEDICDSFVARYVAPESFTHHSHNHDKIVNFIGSAWDAIINQSNGKVKFYKEES